MLTKIWHSHISFSHPFSRRKVTLSGEGRNSHWQGFCALSDPLRHEVDHSPHSLNVHTVLWGQPRAWSSLFCKWGWKGLRMLSKLPKVTQPDQGKGRISFKLVQVRPAVLLYLSQPKVTDDLRQQRRFEYVQHKPQNEIHWF